MTLRLSNAEYQRHREALFAKAAPHNLDAFVTFIPNNVVYFSSFGFISTERPIAFIFNEKTSVLLVPRLEEEHAQEVSLAEKIVAYPEYPGLRHPLEFLKDILVDLGVDKGRIGVDGDGYGRIFGYRGPSVSQLVPEATVVNVLDEIEYLQSINSPEELELIRESAKWGNLAHAYLQEYSKVGVSELEISLRASTDATLAQIRALGPDFRPRGDGARAAFRGQVGKASANPHALANNAKLKPGDILGTFGGSSIWGYGSELERTLIVGEPSAEQEKFFGLLVEVQDLALNAIRPGIPTSAVDDAVNAFFKEHDLEQYWRHHTGHAKSTLIHEAPFLDSGDQTPIEVGQVFTVEPGIYVPDLGGFRHSDTVVVTEDGIDFITYYPRDLESLIVPV